MILTDIGNSLAWAERNLLIRRPNSVYGFGGLAAMGSGVAAVVGAQVAAGSRPAVAICGDGDFQMHGMEVMTAPADASCIRCATTSASRSRQSSGSRLHRMTGMPIDATMASSQAP